MEASVDQQAAVPESIYGEEGAISMAANPAAGDNMSFDVMCYSFQPPRVQLDETGPQTPMTETTAPDGTGNPGVYNDTVTFTSEGDHVIICFNAITRVRQRVLAGDYPTWDPDKYQKTAVQIAANERAKAAKMFQTRGKIG